MRIMETKFWTLAAAALLTAGLVALLILHPWAGPAERDPSYAPLEPPEPAQKTENRQGTEMAPEPSNPAPEFPAGLDWLNTDRPISLADLRGKVVLLDFWTYCCINCMHVLEDLARLEEKYRNELAVIGVHSAKFTGEKDSQNIRQAILRYNISHPVVNDADMRIWRSYNVHAWPTLVLIDPAGGIAAVQSGEGIYERFDRMIADLVGRFDAQGKLDRRSLGTVLEQESVGDSLLSFPGKVLADEASGRLFIADSNHNRIVVVSLDDMTVQQIIGSGRPGLNDGAASSATFRNPQGMALDGGTLYVCDTDNHGIRAIDLANREVRTVAGLDPQAAWGAGGGKATETPLNSPWDLELIDGVLYIAMAGSHQLWRLDLKGSTIAPYAGSGREGRVDGPLAVSALAQPSGLTTDGQKLYFADSEVSCIRSADLDLGGKVMTLVGGDLFDFGDVDGVGDRARLQHPLGVVYDNGVLYVADTYNNKIKRLIVDERRIEAFAGSGQAGLVDGEDAMAVAFDEPAGLSVAAGKIYVADTNNQVIRVVDITTRAVSTLKINNARALVDSGFDGAIGSFAGEQVYLPEQTIRPGASVMKVEVDLPAGLKLTPDAPSSVTVLSADEAVLQVDAGEAKLFELGQEAPITAMVGSTTLTVDVSIFYCSEGRESLCYFRQLRLFVPVTVKAGAEQDRILLRPSPAVAAGL